MRAYILPGLVFFLASACTPSTRGNRPSQLFESDLTRTLNPSNRSSPVKRRPAVTSLADGSIRLRAKEAAVWQHLVDLLVRDYNLTILNRAEGVVTTDWDRFYVDSKLHRQRISLRISRASWSHTDLVWNNQIEMLSEGYDGTALGAIWVPGYDSTNREKRLFDQLSARLGFSKKDSEALTFSRD